MRNYTNNDLFSQMAIFEELSIDFFLEKIPKTLEISKFYPYEVNIMVLHSKKGIPKLHCFSR